MSKNVNNDITTNRPIQDHINIDRFFSSYHAFAKDADIVIGSIGCASSSICNGTNSMNFYLIS